MHFSNIVSEGEFDEKEVSISSKELFKGDLEFSKNSLKTLKKAEGLKNYIILMQSYQ